MCLRCKDLTGLKDVRSYVLVRTFIGTNLVTVSPQPTPSQLTHTPQNAEPFDAPAPTLLFSRALPQLTWRLAFHTD